METITIKRKLVEDALDELKAAQRDIYIKKTQRVIDELEIALQQPVEQDCQHEYGIKENGDVSCFCCKCGILL